MNTDPISDYLTRLRNAIMANHKIVEIPTSKTKREITKILFEKGYILNYKFVDGPGLQRQHDAGGEGGGYGDCGEGD